MNLYRAVAAGCIALAVCCSVPLAGAPVPYDFVASGVKAAGLGGAFTALADDAGSIHYNPAGTFQIGRGAFSWQLQSILKIQRLIDTSHKLEWDLIPLTVLSFPFAGKTMSGSFFIKTFFRSMAESYTVHGTGVSWSWKLNEVAAVGISTGLAVGHQDENWSFGWFVHTGVLLRLSESLKAGIVWHSPIKLHWDELRGDYRVDERLPWLLQGGVSWRVTKKVIVSFDLEYQGVGAKSYTANGVSYNLPDMTGLFKNIHPHLGVQLLHSATGARLRFGFMTAATSSSSGVDTRPAVTAGIGAYTSENFRLDFALQDSLLFDIFTETDRYEWFSFSIEYHF